MYHVNRLKVLIADDDADDRELFSETLSSLYENATCIQARDGAEAFHQIQLEKPDFVFLDLYMPVCDGFRCMEKIKADKKLHVIPVIIYSASSREADKQKIKGLGANFYITKPYDLNNLRSLIEFAIEEKWMLS